MSLLPPNSTALEVAIEETMLAALSEIDVPVSVMMDPDKVPAKFLPWLAWALSVDEWDVAWSEDSKRATIANSIDVHRHKGTVGSIKRALSAAGYGDAELIEDYNTEKYDGSHLYDGTITYASPDHWAEYRVRLTRPISIEQAARVRRILADIAPVRCHLVALDYPEALNLYDGTITYDGQFTYGVA